MPVKSTNLKNVSTSSEPVAETLYAMKARAGVRFNMRLAILDQSKFIDSKSKSGSE